MRRRRQESPARVAERTRRRVRFAVLDAKKAGITTKEVHEITVTACEQWRFMNG